MREGRQELVFRGIGGLRLQALCLRACKVDAVLFNAKALEIGSKHSRERLNEIAFFSEKWPFGRGRTRLAIDDFDRALPSLRRREIGALDPRCPFKPLGAEVDRSDGNSRRGDVRILPGGWQQGDDAAEHLLGASRLI